MVERVSLVIANGLKDAGVKLSTKKGEVSMNDASPRVFALYVQIY